MFPSPRAGPCEPRSRPRTACRPALARFAVAHPHVPSRFVQLPWNLISANMHLDPDFGHLTYGDSGVRRGKRLADLSRGDFVVFYASLRPVAACEHRLVYALVGLYRVSEVVRLRSVAATQWSENAHTRCVNHAGSRRDRPGRTRLWPVKALHSDRSVSRLSVPSNPPDPGGLGRTRSMATSNVAPSHPAFSTHGDSSVGSNGRGRSWSVRTTFNRLRRRSARHAPLRSCYSVIAIGGRGGSVDR